MDENLKKEFDAFLDGRKAKRKADREAKVEEAQRRKEYKDRLHNHINTVIWPALEEIASACRAKGEPANITEPPPLGSTKWPETGILIHLAQLQVVFQGDEAEERVVVYATFSEPHLLDAEAKNGSYPIDEVTTDFVQKLVWDLLKQT